jgi:GT2 family glycosyltransferase
MCAVLPLPSHSSDAGFARAISRKFAHGRFLIVGVKSQEIERGFAELNREAVVTWSLPTLPKPAQGGAADGFETVVWFYSSGENGDNRMVETLAHCAANIVLTPGPGADATKRRPQLVAHFEQFGVRPDYECDLIEVDPAAVCLRHQSTGGTGAISPAVETAFARLNKALSDVKRSFQIRGSELQEAHRHIAALEEKLLKVKEYRRELKLLKEQKQVLRKSPERRIGQVLLAPYRLPEKLAKTVWKKLRLPEKKVRGSITPSEYQKWFEQHRATAHGLAHMRDESRRFSSRPLISVITPVFETPPQHLEEAIESVLAQAYENWELILVDDGSSAADLLHALPLLPGRDRRIVLKSLGTHAGISAASNQGLALARGEWVTFLDHDDVLEPDAFFQIVKLLQTYPDADLVYSDEDKLGADGFEAPLLKPDWSPDLFHSYNYIGHLTAIRRDVVQKAGGFRSRFDSAQDYDLFFRVIEQTKRVHHIPRVLYHWRRSEKSSAISVRQKPEQLEASRLAIEDHLKRSGDPAHVAVDWRTHAFCVRRELLEATRISMIIWSRQGLESLERCIDSVTSNTNYPNYEIVIVQDDESAGSSGFSSRFPHRFLRLPGVANASAAKNFAVKQTDDSWILFLDDSIEPIDANWLTIMAEHVQRSAVGAVGARLLSPNGAVEQAGMVLGVTKTAQPAFHGFLAEDPGANRQLQVTRNCSVISSACMLTRREIFQEAEGFDDSLDGLLADVDLCLKMRRAGRLIVYTPFAKLCWHRASGNEIDANGEAMMHARWADALQNDPYYNPNLSRERADFSLGN